MKTKHVLQMLNDSGFHPDKLTRRGDVFIYRRGFFYPHGQTAGKIADKMKESFPNMEITDYETVWKPFNGFAPVSRQSHFQVRFKLNENA